MYTYRAPRCSSYPQQPFGKLANSKWETYASTIGTTAVALCYLIAEYDFPVCGISSHADILDPELNKAWRAIT